MPMIVNPSAPPVSPPTVVTSTDGWLSAAVDTTWAGVYLAVNYADPPGTATPYASAANVHKVRITRLDPGATEAVPVRSADRAWALGGTGRAYDHEAPLGVGVVYSATPLLADGSEGPTSTVALSIPAPVGWSDVWLKSLDDPGSSLLVHVTEWPTLTWAARTDTAAVLNSPYPSAALDTYSSASSTMKVHVDPENIAGFLALARTPQVLLIQTLPAYHRPDQYAIFGDLSEDIYAQPEHGRIYTVPVTEVDRPDTAGNPLRIPGWSWDHVAAQFATFDAVAASYSSFALLSTNGAL